MAQGNMEQASHFYEEAVKKDPNDVTYHLSLVETLALQKRYDEAMRQAKKSTEYMLSIGRKDDADQLKELMRRFEIENRK
jgi:tetratricopeptide (TPR) repeat protein